MSEEVYPFMSRATALWFIDNTSLTFEQIGAFCGLDVVIVRAIADGDICNDIASSNPVLLQHITQHDLDECQEDSSKKLKLSQKAKARMDMLIKRKQGATPRKRSIVKPGAVLWLLENYPGMRDEEIATLIGTSKKIVISVRNRSHKNIKEIRSMNPILLGLCSAEALKKIISFLDITTV